MKLITPKSKPDKKPARPSSNWAQFQLNGATSKNKTCDWKKKKHKALAIDCEMVADINGEDMLARVSIVDYNLTCIYDKYVKPTSDIADYRTRFSGIRPESLKNAEDFEKVQMQVKELLRDKLLIGHGLRNDLNVLRFGHHRRLIRDTSLFKPFRETSAGKTPSLRKLVRHFLQESIQEGEHDSIVDAASAMKLYVKFRKQWENSLVRKEPALDVTSLTNKKS